MLNIRKYNAKFLVFTSTVGVDIFFSSNRNPDPSHVYVAIGSSTKERIQSYGFHASCPDVMDSSGLGELISHMHVDGERVALLRSNRSGNELPEILSAAGIDFKEFTLYDIVEIKDNNLDNFIMRNKVYGIIVTSSMEAKILGEFHLKIINERNIILFPIGTPTEKAISAAGFSNSGIKGESSVEMLIRKIENENCPHSGEWI